LLYWTRDNRHSVPSLHKIDARPNSEGRDKTANAVVAIIIDDTDPSA